MSDAKSTDAIDLLNTLLEAERAGVAAVADLREVAPPDPGVRLLLEQLGEDEARYVAGLHRTIRRLGGEPSSATGDFVEKIRALPDFPRKLALLDRGQRWVARKIAEHRKLFRDDETRSFLAEMEVRHELNVARCASLLAELLGSDGDAGGP